MLLLSDLQKTQQKVLLKVFLSRTLDCFFLAIDIRKLPSRAGVGVIIKELLSSPIYMK